MLILKKIKQKKVLLTYLLPTYQPTVVNVMCESYGTSISRQFSQLYKKMFNK